MQINLFGEQVKDITFTDVKFMTAEEKMKVYKDFKKVVDHKDINKLTERLYTHLYVHCSDFIAHYDINGFKAEYGGRGPKGFRRFVNIIASRQFVIQSTYGEGNYYDINKAMLEYLLPYKDLILKHLDTIEVAEAKQQIKFLASKYGIKAEELLD